ncbi:MAG: PAS domain S-box protein [Methanoregula sp.]|nr:PAS domain S-box protein [Methanoregula sp.]
MDFLFFDDVRKKPYLILALIIVSSIAILLLNVYGLTYGITYVLPHLFYIPIILAAYYYPRRGVLFAVGLSVVYCAVSFIVVTPTTVELLSAIARSGVFIVIAAVVSYLSGRMHHDTQMCRRLVSVVKSSADAISGETLNGIVTDWNAGAEQLYGFTSREMMGTSIFRLIPPELHEEKRLLLEKIRQGEPVERVETERIKKDGTCIQVSLSLSPIFNSIGEIIGISGIAHDITERQRFQHEIVKAKDRWELTFDAVPDMIAIIDDHFRIVQVNKAMADRLGVSTEAAVGLTCYEVVHHTTTPVAICPHQLLLKDGQGHSTEIHEDNLNGDFFLTVSPIRDPSGAVLGSVHILRDITERKKAENALKESKEKITEHDRFLQQLIETIPNPVFYKDKNGRYTGCNTAFERYIGLSKDKLVGKSVYDIAPKDLADIYYAQDRKLLDNPGTQIYESIVRYADSSIHDVIFNKASFTDSIGNSEGLVGVIIDITERKKMESALQESETKFREIFNSANDAIHLHEIDERGLPGKFIDVNDVACRMLQYSKEELLEKNPLDLTTDYHSRPLDKIGEEIKTKGSAIFETEHRRKDGGIVPVEVSVHIVVIHGRRMVLSIIRDLTRRKQDEAAFRQLSADHKAIIEHAPAMIFYKDTKNTFIRVNPAGARAFGLAVEEIEGKSAYALFPDFAEKYYQDDLEVISSKKPKLGIVEPMTTTSGEHLWVQTDKIPLKDAQGTVTGVLLFVVDITERKQVEEALALASKKLSLLSSITRHDINNQLMALNAYISLSGEAIGNPVELKEFIDKEQKIADSIAHQIRFTKDYENLGVKAPVWQNVTAIFKNIIPRLPMRNIRIDAEDPDLELFADPLLEKVFYNLVDNALRYGGEKMTAIRMTTRKDNGVLVIAVEDDGNGISAYDKKELFKKGFGKHTGLGLFLSREILSLTGITITENGEPGVGARFEIVVPAGAWRMTGKSA